jgi:hypothetical protein
MQPAVLIVVIFFACSLVAAYVLFKLLRSTAIVKTEKAQAGGAAAGFLLVLFALFNGHRSVSGIESLTAQIQALTDQLKSAQEELNSTRAELNPKIIIGKIRPNLGETKIVLSVAATDPDGSGSFRVDGRCIDPKRDDVRLYFIREGRNVFQFLDALSDTVEEYDIATLEGR